MRTGRPMSPAGGGGLAEELWGHLGASGLASARVGGCRVNHRAVESSRARKPPAAGPVVVLLVGSFLRPSPAGGGGLAEELWGHLGARGRASARVGASGVCAL